MDGAIPSCVMSQAILRWKARSLLMLHLCKLCFIRVIASLSLPVERQQRLGRKADLFRNALDVSCLKLVALLIWEDVTEPSLLFWQ